MEHNKYLHNFINICWILIKLIISFLFGIIIFLYINIDNYNIRIDYKRFVNESNSNYFNFYILNKNFYN